MRERTEPGSSCLSPPITGDDPSRTFPRLLAALALAQRAGGRSSAAAAIAKGQPSRAPRGFRPKRQTRFRAKGAKTAASAQSSSDAADRRA
jgi:hypothetical protein